jgi:RNA polymerase sigma factor (sigma-70 family)
MASDGRMPDFAARSFGAWLATRVRWRVLDYHRHRHRRELASAVGTVAVNDCSEPFDRIWEAEWQRKLLAMGLSRVGEKPRNLLIFQALALHGRPVEEVCREFGISRTNAETIKNRIKDKLTAEIARLEREGV